MKNPHNKRRDRVDSRPSIFVCARVYDAEGSGARRFFRVSGGALILMLGAATLNSPLWDWFCDLPPLRPYDGMVIDKALVLVWTILALLWPWLLPRRRAGVTELVVRGHMLEIDAQSRFCERLESTSIAAAHACNVLEGASLIIERKHGSPMFLEFARIEDALIVHLAVTNRAPGQNHSSAIQLCGRRNTPGVIRAILEWTTRIAGLAICYPAIVSFTGAFESYTIKGIHVWSSARFGGYIVVAWLCVAMSLILRLLGHYERGTALVFGKTKLGIGDMFRIPYQEITDVRTNKRSLEIDVINMPKPIRLKPPGLGKEEIDHIAAHILDMVRKSKQPSANADATSAPVDALSKSAQEDTRAWLRRLDGFARGDSDNPYRNVPFERERLVGTIADSTAPIVERAGAARVLWRIDPKVANEAARALDRKREAELRDRLETIMQADIEAASEEYDQLPPPFRVFSRRE